MSQHLKSATKAIYLGIAGNTALALIKGVTGFVGNSYALIADAIESSSDIFSSILLLIGLRYISRPADENHPYGHGRAEPLFTFGVVVFLMISATLITVEAIKNIQTPHETPETYTLCVLAFIILVKELFYRLVRKKGEETQSGALKADAWHHRSDAITSLAAFVGILIAILAGPGYETADDWAALVASVIILYNAYLIFRPALSEIMDEQRYDDFIEKIRVTATEVPGVVSTEKCFVRKMGMDFQVDLHAIVDAEITVREGHKIAHRLKDYLMIRYSEIADVHIHIETNDPELTPTN